jgi:hypothetical protein
MHNLSYILLNCLTKTAVLQYVAVKVFVAILCVGKFNR